MSVLMDTPLLTLLYCRLSIADLTCRRCGQDDSVAVGLTTWGGTDGIAQSHDALKHSFFSSLRNKHISSLSFESFRFSRREQVGLLGISELFQVSDHSTSFIGLVPLSNHIFLAWCSLPSL